MQSVRFPAFLGLISLLATGCDGDPTGFSGQVAADRFFAGAYAVVNANPSAATAKLDGLTVALQTAAAPNLVEATLVTGDRPQGTGAPGALLELQSSIITGMPAKLLVSGDAPFTRIALSVPGAENYWEIVLPSATLAVQVIATGASSIPNTDFPMEIAVGTELGYGNAAREDVHAVDLAASDVAVILRWNAPSDVDLHVTDGKGIKVYFANPSTNEGGQLDLDSNPACSIDGVNQEVITWPVGKAPVGEYKVEVDYWSDCGVARSDYAVTFMVHGRTVQVQNGFFEGRPEVTRHEVARFGFP
ncbi:MAG: YfaP family protein [Gemmatimonadales bacterium]